MKDIVYNFLDKTVGSDVKCTLTSSGYNYKHYLISSTKCRNILEFRVFNDDRISIFRSKRLCDMVSGFFNFNEEESSNQIKFWFGDKHDLNKVRDIKKFVREK